MLSYPNPRSAPGHRRSRGVTLVEVVIAIFVLTVGVLGIISLFPTGAGLGQQAMDRSVGALAARDAMALIMSEAKWLGVNYYPKADSSEPLYQYVPENQRVGTVHTVGRRYLICEGGAPDGTTYDGFNTWTSSRLRDYYLVMTSGTATGRVYQVSGSSVIAVTGQPDRGRVDFYSSGTHEVAFRTLNDDSGEPVRVGDHVAIIGSKTGRRCFPQSAGGGMDATPDHSSFLFSTDINRVINIATHGATDPRPGTVPWEYSYGCIFTAPSKELKYLYRVDVLVYRGFDIRGSLEQQRRPAGHFVTYISNFEDYANAY